MLLLWCSHHIRIIRVVFSIGYTKTSPIDVKPILCASISTSRCVSNEKDNSDDNIESPSANTQNPKKQLQSSIDDSDGISPETIAETVSKTHLAKKGHTAFKGGWRRPSRSLVPGARISGLLSSDYWQTTGVDPNVIENTVGETNIEDRTKDVTSEDHQTTHGELKRKWKYNMKTTSENSDVKTIDNINRNESVIKNKEAPWKAKSRRRNKLDVESRLGQFIYEKGESNKDENK